MHLPAAPLEKPADSITVRGPPAVADVDRAGRVSGHELDLNPVAVRQVRAGEALFTLGHDLDQHLLQPALMQPEVDEPAPGHLHGRDMSGRRRVEDRTDLLGQLPRFPPVRASNLHGHVRGPVAVLSTAGLFQLNFRRIDGDTQLPEGTGESLGQYVFNTGHRAFMCRGEGDDAVPEVTRTRAWPRNRRPTTRRDQPIISGGQLPVTGPDRSPQEVRNRPERL